MFPIYRPYKRSGRNTDCGSITTLLRWETFGGIDYRINEHIALSAKLVNFLNQKGANGAIGAADVVTDAKLYQNYLMSGSFIRSFTTELSVKIDF